jgi:hypothetical protein
MNQFRPHLLEAEPTFENGLVLTGQDSDSGINMCRKGTPFAIVHQYDRVPVWKKYVREKYKQEDESQMFNYSVG